MIWPHAPQSTTRLKQFYYQMIVIAILYKDDCVRSFIVTVPSP